MNKKHLLILFFFFMIWACWGQTQHQFHLGYTYSQVRPLDRTPLGTGTTGTLHKTRNFKGLSGASVGYEWLIPLKEIFFISVGVNGIWYQSSLEYSLDFYGNPCSSCQSFNKEERIGFQSKYSTISLQFPISISVPLTEKGNAFFKVGWDALWLVENLSQWNYLSVNWRFEQNNNIWSSTAIGQSIERRQLDVFPFQQGVFIGLWKKLELDQKQIITLQGSLRMGLSRINQQPVLGQVNYGLQFGYLF